MCREVSGVNSAARMSAFQAERHGFESRTPLHTLSRTVMFILLREDRNHPTGWVQVGKFKTLEQAQHKAKTRELMMAWQYSERNSDRQYHCIEFVEK